MEITISGIQDLDLLQTFICGQCFRWIPEADGSFSGVAGGRSVNVSLSGGRLIIEATSNDAGAGDAAFWRNYFDLDTDYGALKERLGGDAVLKKAIEYGGGRCILRQDLFECIISFIISANNNITRISGIIERLSDMFGEATGGGRRAFPSLPRLYGVTAAELAPLRAGYRAGYIEKTVKLLADGEVSLEKIRSLPFYEARREIMRLPGVGPKVADCARLFGDGRLMAFPADVWVGRVMAEMYGGAKGDAARMGRERFGELAGLAQQYLFYWRRNA
jgi:N-glycosylase/DNA lyase